MSSVYQDLDPTKSQIRLLSVNQAEESNDIACTLQTFDVSSAPSYQALSYAWGSPDRKHGIRINGSEIRISENLFEFLQVYRKRDDRGLIWIDQLCINQSDDKEKGRQVGMMHDIYRKAKLTLIWLGADHQRVLPFNTLNKLWNSWLDNNAWHPNRSLGLWDSNIGQLAEVAWKLLADLPYWRRHWILQEVTISRHTLLLFGEEEHAWQRFIGIAFYAPGYRQHVIESIVDTRSMYDADTPFYTTWENVMKYARKSICSDPRDKVFGSQSILPKSLRVEPDYGLSVREVFFKAVKLYFDGFDWDKSLDLGIDHLPYGSICLAFGMGLTAPALHVEDYPSSVYEAQMRFMRWLGYNEAAPQIEISWQQFREFLEQDVLADEG